MLSGLARPVAVNVAVTGKVYRAGALARALMGRRHAKCAAESTLRGKVCGRDSLAARRGTNSSDHTTEEAFAGRRCRLRAALGCDVVSA